MCVTRIKYTASGSAIKSGPTFLGKWVKLTQTRGLAGFGVIPRRYPIAAELMVRIHSPPAASHERILRRRVMSEPILYKSVAQLTRRASSLRLQAIDQTIR